MASGTISLGTSGAMTGQIVWSSYSNGTAANSSNVTATLQIKRTNSYTTTGTFGYGINVGGKAVETSWYGSISNSWTTIATLSNPVAHNNNGTGSCYLEAYVNGPSGTSLSGNTVTAKQTVTLDTIPRQANLTSAPNFNDEQSPAITYSNPAGNSVTTLRACIADDAMNYTYANWRDISKTGNSYTFNLTDTERNALRNAIPNSNTLTVRFMIETNIGGVLYYSNIPRTLTIVNGNPVLSPTIKDVGTGSLALTGDANKIIKGFNYIEYTSGASAKKGASIVSQKVVCGSKTATNGNGSFTDVDSASFVFSVTDSRGNTTTQTINKTLIDYVKLTCNIGDKKPDVNGNMKVECSGNYFNGSFGAVANTLNVQYRYKVQGGEYSDWTNMTITKDGNTYTAEADLTGLNYQTTYVFQTKAVDKIYWEGVLSEEITVRSYPVFDWGKNDFNVNGDFNIKNKSFLDLVYPIGAIYMSMSNTNPTYLFGGEWENIQGRFLIAAGTGTDQNNITKTFEVGQTGGEYDHTLTIQEIPPHNHAMANAGNLYYASGSSASWMPGVTDADTYVDGTTRDTGGGWTHNTTPPYLAVYMWKRIS